MTVVNHDGCWNDKCKWSEKKAANRHRRTHSCLFSSLAFLLGDFGQDGCNECNAFQMLS